MRAIIWSAGQRGREGKKRRRKVRESQVQVDSLGAISECVARLRVRFPCRRTWPAAGLLMLASCIQSAGSG